MINMLRSLSLSWERKMLVAQNKSFISPSNSRHCFGHVFKKNGGGIATVTAKRRDFSDKSIEERPVFQIRVPNTTLARTGIAVLGLGFIDAGYSGDWSRIGAISEETEEFLKVAAFVVVPLFIFIGLSFYKNSTD